MKFNYTEKGNFTITNANDTESKAILLTARINNNFNNEIENISKSDNVFNVTTKTIENRDNAKKFYSMFKTAVMKSIECNKNIHDVDRTVEKSVPHAVMTTKGMNFIHAVRKLEDAIINDTKDKDELLIAVADGITSSVLKKLSNVGTYVSEDSKVKHSNRNRMMTKLRNEFYYDRKRIEAMSRLAEEYGEYRYNKNGKLEFIVTDELKEKELDKMIRMYSSDASDLRNVAIVTLLEKIKTAPFDIRQTENFLEYKYNIKKLRRRTIISPADYEYIVKKTDNKSEQTADTEHNVEYVDIETCIIVECFKAVRKAVDDARQVQILNNKYSYIEEYRESDNDDEIVYRRLPKYDLMIDDETGCCMNSIDINNCDVNSKVFAECMSKIKNIATPLEMSILNLRRRGYGYDVIAVALKRSKSTIRTSLRALGDRCLQNDVFSDAVLKHRTKLTDDRLSAGQLDSALNEAIECVYNVLFSESVKEMSDKVNKILK